MKKPPEHHTEHLHQVSRVRHPQIRRGNKFLRNVFDNIPCGKRLPAEGLEMTGTVTTTHRDAGRYRQEVALVEKEAATRKLERQIHKNLALRAYRSRLWKPTSIVTQMAQTVALIRKTMNGRRIACVPNQRLDTAAG